MAVARDMRRGKKDVCRDLVGGNMKERLLLKVSGVEVDNNIKM
jgi:hypothetical protein